MASEPIELGRISASDRYSLETRRDHVMGNVSFQMERSLVSFLSPRYAIVLGSSNRKIMS